MEDWEIEKTNQNNNIFKEYFTNAWRTPTGKVIILFGSALFVTYLSGKLMRFFAFVVDDYKSLRNVIKS